MSWTAAKPGDVGGGSNTVIVPTTTTKHSMILQKHAVLSARAVSVIADSVFSIPGHLEYLPFFCYLTPYRLLCQICS